MKTSIHKYIITGSFICNNKDGPFLIDLQNHNEGIISFYNFLFTVL